MKRPLYIAWFLATPLIALGHAVHTFVQVCGEQLPLLRAILTGHR